jgi:hypothetical protein
VRFDHPAQQIVLASPMVWPQNWSKSSMAGRRNPFGAGPPSTIH